MAATSAKEHKDTVAPPCVVTQLKVKRSKRMGVLTLPNVTFKIKLNYITALSLLIGAGRTLNIVTQRLKETTNITSNLTTWLYFLAYFALENFTSTQ